MNEEEIVARLKSSIPVNDAPTTSPIVQTPVTDEASTHGQVNQLDEITKYKLQDYFGVRYRPTDEVSNQQVAYIYETVSKSLEDKDYGFVISRIRELERMIGTANSDNRVYKLYQWLKLENIRKNIELQQGALVDG